MSFTHYVNIPVNHSSDGEQTNYQMKLNIVKGTGSNTTGTIYLNNHSLNWPYDIEFRNYNGDVLDYWREEYDDTDMTIWIECDSIASSGETDFYLYYGNSGAVDESDGESAFLFFDDFSGSSVDNNKWSVSGTGTPTISNGMCTLTAPSAVNSQQLITSKYSHINNNYVAMTKARVTQLETGYMRDNSFRLGHDSKYKYCLHGTPSSRREEFLEENIEWEGYGNEISLNQWYIIEIWLTGAYVCNGRLNHGITRTWSRSNEPTNKSIILQVLTTQYNSGNVTSEVDWVAVRNFTISEPTWSIPSNETELGGSQSSSSNAYFGGLAMF